MKTPLNRYEKRQLWQKYQAQKQTNKQRVKDSDSL